MTKKETEDLTHDILTYFSVAGDPQASAGDAANCATDLFKTMLKRYPAIRFHIWEWGQEHVLDELDLDYGEPK